jgi:hypothetical protein
MKMPFFTTKIVMNYKSYGAIPGVYGRSAQLASMVDAQSNGGSVVGAKVGAYRYGSADMVKSRFELRENTCITQYR